MLKPSAVSRISLKPSIALMSTIRSGSMKPPFILTRRSLPPARIAAVPADPGNQSDGIFHGQWTYVAHRLPWVVAAQLL